MKYIVAKKVIPWQVGMLSYVVDKTNTKKAIIDRYFDADIDFTNAKNILPKKIGDDDYTLEFSFKAGEIQGFSKSTNYLISNWNIAEDVDLPISFWFVTKVQTLYKNEEMWYNVRITADLFGTFMNHIEKASKGTLVLDQYNPKEWNWTSGDNVQANYKQDYGNVVCDDMEDNFNNKMMDLDSVKKDKIVASISSSGYDYSEWREGILLFFTKQKEAENSFNGVFEDYNLSIPLDNPKDVYKGIGLEQIPYHTVFIDKTLYDEYPSIIQKTKDLLTLPEASLTSDHWAVQSLDGLWDLLKDALNERFEESGIGSDNLSRRWINEGVPEVVNNELDTSWNKTYLNSLAGISVGYNFEFSYNGTFKVYSLEKIGPTNDEIHDYWGNRTRTLITYPTMFLPINGNMNGDFKQTGMRYIQNKYFVDLGYWSPFTSLFQNISEPTTFKWVVDTTPTPFKLHIKNTVNKKELVNLKFRTSYLEVFVIYPQSFPSAIDTLTIAKKQIKKDDLLIKNMTSHLLIGNHYSKSIKNILSNSIDVDEKSIYDQDAINMNIKPIIQPTGAGFRGFLQDSFFNLDIQKLTNVSMFDSLSTTSIPMDTVEYNNQLRQRANVLDTARNNTELQYSNDIYNANMNFGKNVLSNYGDAMAGASAGMIVGGPAGLAGMVSSGIKSIFGIAEGGMDYAQARKNAAVQRDMKLAEINATVKDITAGNANIKISNSKDLYQLIVNKDKELTDIFSWENHLNESDTDTLNFIRSTYGVKYTKKVTINSLFDLVSHKRNHSFVKLQDASLIINQIPAEIDIKDFFTSLLEGGIILNRLDTQDDLTIINKDNNNLDVEIDNSTNFYGNDGWISGKK